MLNIAKPTTNKIELNIIVIIDITFLVFSTSIIVTPSSGSISA